MIFIPPPEEWSTAALPADRRAYLEGGLSFDEIAMAIAEDAKVESAEIRPYYNTRNKQEKIARQVVYRVCVSSKNCDLFYNAPDGLRSRYWQSPDVGFRATRSLIDAVKPKLLEFAVKKILKIAEKQIHPMTIGDIEASLDAKSAKIWPCEIDSKGNRTMPFEGKPQLDVLRWKLNEDIARNGPLWRWTPDDRDLEIKGALLDPEGGEHIPQDKRDRSDQIHRYGFT